MNLQRAEGARGGLLGTCSWNSRTFPADRDRQGPAGASVVENGGVTTRAYAGMAEAISISTDRQLGNRLQTPRHSRGLSLASEGPFDAISRVFSSSSLQSQVSRLFPVTRSVEYFLGDVAGHVGEAEIAAGIAVSQLFVVQPHQRQQRRVQVSNVHPPLDGVQAVVVGAAV